MPHPASPVYLTCNHLAVTLMAHWCVLDAGKGPSYTAHAVCSKLKYSLVGITAPQLQSFLKVRKRSSLKINRLRKVKLLYQGYAAKLTEVGYKSTQNQTPCSSHCTQRCLMIHRERLPREMRDPPPLLQISDRGLHGLGKGSSNPWPLKLSLIQGGDANIVNGI